jgi:hypothetical protein
LRFDFGFWAVGTGLKTVRGFGIMAARKAASFFVSAAAGLLK